MKNPWTHAIYSVPVTVTNAQCMSGGVVYGFPSMTAFLGLEAALARAVVSPLLQLDGITVCVHKHRSKTVKKGYDRVPCIIRRVVDTAHSAASNASGRGVALMENVSMDMEATLLFRISGKDAESAIPGSETEAFIQQIQDFLSMSGRVAGGTLSSIPGKKPLLWLFSGEDEADAKMLRDLKKKLLPGFLPFDRTSLLTEHLENMRKERVGSDTLDALLDLCAVHGVKEADEDGNEKKTFTYSRRKQAWLVPACLGFASLSDILPPGSIKDARDMQTKVCFAEPCYSLLEFVSAHRISSFAKMFWFPSIDTIAERTFFLAKNM